MGITRVPPLLVIGLARRFKRTPGPLIVLNGRLQTMSTSNLLWLMAGVSAMSLFGMEFAVFPAPQGYLPDPSVLFVYGPFYLFGWLLYHQQARIVDFTANCWRRLGLGLLWMACTIFGCFVQLNMPELSGAGFYATAVGGSLCVWNMLYALMGIFQLRFNRATVWGRFLSDSSYWIYIVHAPLLFLFQIPLIHLPLAPAVKITLVLIPTTVVSLVSYNWLVRPGRIGVLLNGRRMPRLILVPSFQQIPVVEESA